jgi:hypothetical protein
VIELNEDGDGVTCEAVLEHAAEVWSISPCPSEPALFFTTFNKPGLGLIFICFDFYCFFLFFFFGVCLFCCVFVSQGHSLVFSILFVFFEFPLRQANRLEARFGSYQVWIMMDRWICHNQRQWIYL